jgi:hypothetical protein
MISKIGVGILTVAALLIAVPSNVFAADANATKLKKAYADLKKLPVPSAPAKVDSLVKKCATLDAKKAATYYKTGLSKYTATKYITIALKNSATKLAKDVSTIVKKAKLKPSSLTSKVLKQVDSEKVKFLKKPVTPTAMLSTTSFLATA